MRRAEPADAAHVTEILALAFGEDPVWGWAFPDPVRRVEHLRRWWGLFVDSALPRGGVWLSDDGGAVSVWTEPDEPELSEAAEAQVEPLLRELVGPHADGVLDLVERFEAAAPSGRHVYLGLLGTHPDHRGRGTGMRLLAERLAHTDTGGLPVYLESTNPANDRRYAQLGFERIGEFAAPDGGPAVARMWRDAR